MSGFVFERGQFAPLRAPTQKALSLLDTECLVLSNTASGQEAVFFNNSTSQFKTIDLFEKKAKDQAKRFSSGDEEDGGDDDGGVEEEEEETKADSNGDKEADPEQQPDGAEAAKKAAARPRRKKSSSSEPKFKVKSSIKRVFKHLLLTANGSLYGLQKSFHKKYFGSRRVVEVKCDGSRCALCLDENGVLWSFGINMFGKLGLKRNDKKQIYTNPREIALFKAYKVRDFGITNRCCVAVCANGRVYGWGSCSKSLEGTDSDIWYTPQVISDDAERTRRRWRVRCGFRFMVFWDSETAEVRVANTEFGFTVLEEPRHGLLIATQSVKVPENVDVVDVVASSESAVLVVQ